MYGASHNLEVRKQSRVIKNNILIKDGKTDWNPIMEGLKYQTKELALNSVGSGKQKFCVGKLRGGILEQ